MHRLGIPNNLIWNFTSECIFAWIELQETEQSRRGQLMQSGSPQTQAQAAAWQREGLCVTTGRVEGPRPGEERLLSSRESSWISPAGSSSLCNLPSPQFGLCGLLPRWLEVIRRGFARLLLWSEALLSLLSLLSFTSVFNLVKPPGQGGLCVDLCEIGFPWSSTF